MNAFELVQAVIKEIKLNREKEIQKIMNNVVDGSCPCPAEGCENRIKLYDKFEDYSKLELQMVLALFYMNRDGSEPYKNVKEGILSLNSWKKDHLIDQLLQKTNLLPSLEKGIKKYSYELQNLEF